ncbi:carboxypeptidase-like regulatory domain-containing protein [Cellulophaga fucicola]
MKKNLLFLIFISACFFANGQVVLYKAVKGTIMSTAEEVVGVYVINTTSGQATIANANGFFVMPANETDTIIFSAVQFKKKDIIVTKKMLESKNNIIVLEETLEELNEVVLDQRTFVSAKSLGLPNADAVVLPQSERLLHDANHGPMFGGLSINMNKLLNAINGRTKMLKKRVARDRRYARSQEMRNSYADSVFIKDLNIPRDRIEEFILYCEVDSEFNSLAREKNDFIIWDFLVRKSLVFLKENENPIEDK